MRPPGGLPTAGQRHGRERRPAVRPWTTRDINVNRRQPTNPESDFVTVDRNGLPLKPEVPDEWRTALAQRVEVSGLVVRSAGLPAPVQDPDPLERQCPDGSLMRTALRSLLPVVSAGPERFVDGLGCPFDERLAQELRALPPPVHPALLAPDVRRMGSPDHQQIVMGR